VEIDQWVEVEVEIEGYPLIVQEHALRRRKVVA